MEPIRLLVADDHEIVRRGIRTLLEAQPGWQVTAEASDGREAVEKALEIKPDFVAAKYQLTLNPSVSPTFPEDDNVYFGDMIPPPGAPPFCTVS